MTNVFFFLLYLLSFMNSRVCPSYRSWSWKKEARYLKSGENHLWSQQRRCSFSTSPIQLGLCKDRSLSSNKSAHMSTGKPSSHLLISFFCTIFFFPGCGDAHTCGFTTTSYVFFLYWGNSWNISHRRRLRPRWPSLWERNRTFPFYFVLIMDTESEIS